MDIVAQIGTNPLVRFPCYRCLIYMNQEARIGYLCFQAARNDLTLDEVSELFGYMAVQPEVLDCILIEIMLLKRG